MARYSDDTDTRRSADDRIAYETNRPQDATPEHAAQRAALLGVLDEIGGLSTNTDNKLRFEGDAFIFPTRYSDDIDGIHRYLKEYQRAQNAQTSFVKFFPARPYDGAAALERALKRLFGSVGSGIPTVTMFGSNPPSRIDVQTSLGASISVPWGEISFEPLEATFETGAMRNDDDQIVFGINVTCPKRQEPRVRALFSVIEDEIAQRSIYRGKAIAVRGSGQAEPKFLDLSGVNPDQVVYAADIYRQLTAGLWSPIRHGEKLKSLGQTLKATTLLEGPYGTGKSMAGVLTAQIAVAHGWTFIHVAPGERIEIALELARQYGPAVVWIEDVDTVAGGNLDRARVVKVLEALDGVTSKVAGGLLVGMTTNHVEKLDPAVLRPGRIDTIIHVAQPDRLAFEGIIRKALPVGGADTLDFDELWGVMGPEDGVRSTLDTDGMLPAFIVGAVKDSVRYALSRSGGEDSTVTTQDILDAAASLRRTFDLQQKATADHKPADTVGLAIETAVEKVLERAVFMDGDGDRQRAVSGVTFDMEQTNTIKRHQRHGK